MDIFAAAAIVICLWGIKISPKSLDRGFHSRENCTALKGIFALWVFLHHLAQHTADGKLFRLFYFGGFLPVGCFLFLSGYGLFRRLLSGADYLHGFVRKRAGKTLIPHAIVLLISWPLFALVGTLYTPMDVLRSFVGGFPMAVNSWYMVMCFVLYVVFYLAARCCAGKGSGYIIGIVAAFCLLWVAVCRLCGLASNWYVSDLAFPMGMLWAWREEKILRVLESGRNYLIAALVSLAASALLFGAYSLTDRDLFRLLSAALLPAAIFIVCTRVRPDNPVLRFLGKYSLGIYLLQWPVMNTIRYSSIHIKSDLFYGIAALLLTVLGAVLLQPLFDRAARLCAGKIKRRKGGTA